MKRKCLAVGIILLFVGTCIIPLTAQDTGKPVSTSRGNWLYVGGSGPGNYSSIREALLYANNGDTIFVYSGHYFDPVNINKSITLLGEYTRTTILEQHNNYILFVSADNVTISNFTIEGATGYYWNSGAIYVFSNNTILTNLEFFENGGNAIFLKSSHGNVISKNTFQRNHYAITLGQSTHNTITFNTIGYNDNGIYLYSFSENNTISYNRIWQNAKGIELEQGKRNIIDGNYIEQNTVGISFTIWSSNNIIRRNTFSSNANAISLVDHCSKNLFTQNTFLLNTLHVSFINDWNLWIWNFWGRPRIMPYLVWGKISGLFPDTYFPWFQVDFRPCLVPHFVSLIKTLINIPYPWQKR